MSSQKPVLVLCMGNTFVGKTYVAAKLASAWPLADVYTHNPANDEKLRMYAEVDERNPPASLANKLFVLDELDLLCSPHSYKADWVFEVIRRGRHQPCAVIACTQRPALIHKDIRSLWTEVYLFQQSGDSDIAECVRNWGPECEQLRTAPPRKFMFFYRKL